MATKGVLLLANNDNLETVVKKCNANFMAVLTQQTQSETLATQERDVFADEVIERTTGLIGEAVDSLTNEIQSEASARSAKDLDLENAIETVDGRFSDYTMTTDLALVAVSGDYGDLASKPTDPVGSAYLTFDQAYDPNVSIGGTWTLAGTLAIGTETVYAWKRTA